MITITHSDIRSFLTCRRRWYWNYVGDFKKPDRSYGPLALGTRVHAGLEVYYRDGSDPVAEHDKLARVAVEKAELDDGPPWELDQLYKDMIVGRRCIEAHQEWLATEGEDSPYEVVGVEQTVEAPICDGKVNLRGKVDVLFREIDTGFLVVNDLKTAAKKTVREELERSYQHHVYMSALRLADPTAYVSAAYYTVMYKGAREGPVERFRAPGTSRTAPNKLTQIETIALEMLRTMELIETEGTRHVFPTPTDACRWCEFRQPCEVFDESPIAAREMLDKSYIRGGRHLRYGV